MTPVADVRTRYAESAQHYDRYRPSYPAPLIDWVVATAGLAPGARVADVGCGTGIATRLLAARGLATVGIDPSEEMLAYARRAGQARYVCALATATSLAPGSVALVTAAQCFHWFEPEPTLRELARILKPGGWCSAFWNLRAADPFMEAYHALVRAHSAQYGVLETQEAAPAALRALPGVGAVHEAEFTNAQPLDRDGLSGRAYSSSCVKNGVEDKPAFERALGELFDRHQRGGQVEFRYRAVALCWQPV